MSAPLRLFALSSNRSLGLDISEALGQELSKHEERQFEDGEHKIRPLENVRNADVYVIQSLYGDERHSVNDKLIRLLFFLGTLRDAGAQSVTAVTPYLCYSRKDRRTKARDPVGSRYVAQLFEAMRPDCVVTIDVHNIAAFQNAFRTRTEHLEARNPLIEALGQGLGSGDVVVMSPDLGGVKRMHRFHDALCSQLGRKVETAFMDKKRSSGRVSGSSEVIGRVEGATVLLVDDQIVGGTTMVRAALACRAQGAREVIAVATHGLFSHTAADNLAQARFGCVLVTNTVPVLPSPVEPLMIVDVAPLLAETIKRLHGGGSIVDLLAAH